MAIGQVGPIARRQGYILRRRLRFDPIRGAFGVSWKSIAILLVFILGIVLFFYGANYYDEVTGYTGLAFIVASIIAYAVLEVYSALKKRRS